MKKPSDCGTTAGFKVTQSFLESAYVELVSQYFSGDKMPKLGEITMGFVGKKGAHATASCSFRRQIQKGLGGKIDKAEPRANEFAVKGFIISNLRIDFNNAANGNMTEKDAYETLIHEMIHIWQYLNETPTEWAAMPHGRGFLIKSRPMRADGWDIGLRGLGSTGRPMSPAEKLRAKYNKG